MNELLTPQQMGEADRHTIAAGTPGTVLMERAGQAVAREARALLPQGGRVLVLCGPGNNGGDGFVAARLLAEDGIPVEVALAGEPQRLRGDAAWAFGRWTGGVLPFEAADVAGAALVVDAVFGAGLARPVEGIARRVLEAVAARGVPVVAVDVPSGLDGLTGEVQGYAAPATRTVTFARLKPGHLLLPGRELCGRLILADIGISDATVAAVQNADPAHASFMNGAALWRHRLPVPAVAGHKFSRGHAIVLSGSLPATGAARLAARGALRAGAGLVTIASPADALAVHAAALDAVMVRHAEDAEGLAALLADPRITAVVAGPALGIGPATLAKVAVALGGGRAVVLDADALTSHGGAARALGAAVAAADIAGAVVTPHEGEFRRLFEGEREVLDAGSKLERARAAARLLGAVVVLKGADTVIAAPDGRAAVNAHAPPWLATAGSGDVLAGIIGGLAGQGMPVFEAAAAGVWFHGEAGYLLGPGLTAEDLHAALPRVWNRFVPPLRPPERGLHR